MDPFSDIEKQFSSPTAKKLGLNLILVNLALMIPVEGRWNHLFVTLALFISPFIESNGKELWLRFRIRCFKGRGNISDQHKRYLEEKEEELDRLVIDKGLKGLSPTQKSRSSKITPQNPPT